LIAAGVTVMTAVGAPAVRIQRPFEWHPLDAVERGLAAHFLVARGVGAANRFGQRVSAAGLDDVRDLAGGGASWAEIEEQRCFHGRFQWETDNVRRMFATCSSI